MSALVDRITAVQREHYPVFDEGGHINGTVPGKGAWDCWCGEVVNTTFDAVTVHVAERIAEALQLTEECGYQIEGDQPDEPDAWFPAADYKTSRPVTHRRWVSSWITEQEQP